MSWNRKWLRLIAALLALAIVLPGDAAIITRAGKGSALTFAEVDENFTELLAGHTTFIAGCLVTKHTAANTIDISTCVFYDPSTGAVITYAGGTGISAGTLGASQWNQVYMSVSGTTATPVVTNNADPPSTAYQGTARKNGSNQRWIAWFLTDGSSNIIDHQVIEDGRGLLLVSPRAATNAAPFRVVTAGTAASWTSVTLTGAVPKYATVEVLFGGTMQFASGIGPITTGLAVDSALTGTTAAHNAKLSTYTDTGFNAAATWSAINPAGTIMYLVASGGTGATPSTYIDVYSFKVAR